jgi:hypothetical protein
MDSTLIALDAIPLLQPSSSPPPVQTSVSSSVLDLTATTTMTYVTIVTAATMKATIAKIVPLSNTQHVISLKLINTSYLYWQMQIKSYLIRQGVFQFIDSYLPCPPPHMATTDDSCLQVNPSFLR